MHGKNPNQNTWICNNCWFQQKEGIKEGSGRFARQNPNEDTGTIPNEKQNTIFIFSKYEKVYKKMQIKIET